VAEEIRVNVKTKVRNADIRYITHNNREHIVVPSYTLPDNVVMNGGIYLAEEIAKGFKSLEGTLAPVGHPTLNGKAVLANTPEAINAHHVGVWNKNVERQGNRVYVEKWIDVERAKESPLGQQLLSAIEAGSPIHTSTGLITKREMAVNQAGYQWIARDMRFDHDAILFDEPGAATPDEGVGMMVNSAELIVNAICPELVVNDLLEDSYGQKRDAISAAVREVYGSPDCYCYVEDFDDVNVIYNTPKGLAMVGYMYNEDAVVLIGEPTPVVTKTEFVAKGASVVTQVALIKNAVQSPPVADIKPKPLEPEMDENKVGEIVANALKVALAPLAQELGDVKAQLATARDALETNAKAVDDENRAVILAKVPTMTLVVNALSGKPLAELAAQYQTAAAIGAGNLENNADKSDDLSTYKGA
jgi:hypothetical protein